MAPGSVRLAQWRGRFVLLHFWTSSCANCLHVLDELRPLEADFADILTVVGVHSPKFPHEASPDALTAAIARHGITQPMIDDADRYLWQQYAIKAWPTLVLVDPEGYVVAQSSGEGHVAAFADLLDRLAPEYRRKGTLDPGAIARAEPPSAYTPAGAIVLPAARTGRGTDSLLVADTAGHRLVELAPDGRTVLRSIGDGRGTPFTAPSGLTLLPRGLVDYDVLVADTGAHVLRGLRLVDGVVSATIDLPARLRAAGARTVTGAVPDVLSPWDVAWWPAARRVVVAAAGVHLLLTVDLRDGTVNVLAGTTVEGLRDGPGIDGWLAQPSGLAVDGDQVWFVDAETSSLRSVALDGTLTTAIGKGLFDFGHVDGTADVARMQHPLGVTVLPGGTPAIADTFNGAVRHYDPVSGVLATLATGLAEPAAVVALPDSLVVTELAGGRLTHLPLPRTVAVRPGRVHVNGGIEPPDGQVPDDRDGPAGRLVIDASPRDVLASGVGSGTRPRRDVEVRAPGVIRIVSELATCNDVNAAHPACHLTRVEYVLAVRLDPDGATAVP